MGPAGLFFWSSKAGLGNSQSGIGSGVLFGFAFLLIKLRYFWCLVIGVFSETSANTSGG
jgi:hypothetical protein